MKTSKDKTTQMIQTGSRGGAQAGIKRDERKVASSQGHKPGRKSLI